MQFCTQSVEPLDSSSSIFVQISISLKTLNFRAESTKKASEPFKSLRIIILEMSSMMNVDFPDPDDPQTL